MNESCRKYTYRKDTGSGQSSSSEQENIYDSPENILYDEHHHLMCVKVEKLLREGYFFKGISLTDNEIKLSISILGKDINIFNASLEYKEFLKDYGSVYGAGFNIYGPISNDYDGHKVDRVVLAKIDLFSRELKIGIKLEFCWVVACYKSDFYYIDSSSSGKGHVYRVGFDGRPERFAIDFLEFLDNVFRRYELDKSCSDS